MTSIDAKDNERRVRCPYNHAHMMIHYRIQSHIVKCRRHFTGKKVPCLYNATHQIFEPEVAYHYETCPDRIGLDKFTHAPDTINPDRFPVPKLDVEVTENWDDEVVPTYQPMEYCKSNPIIFNNVIHTQSSSMRRNFRLEERQRRALLDEAAKRKKEEQSLMLQAEPLRCPRTVSGGQPARLRNDLGKAEGANTTVSELMAKISLDAHKVTAPKLSTMENNELEAINENTGKQEDEDVGVIPKNDGSNDPSYNNEYPVLGSMQTKRGNGNSQFGAWGRPPAQPGASNQVGAFTPISKMKPLGRGRGTKFSH